MKLNWFYDYSRKNLVIAKKIKEKQIFALPIEKVEELAEAIFDFKDEKDVESWLKKTVK